MMPEASGWDRVPSDWCVLPLGALVEVMKNGSTATQNEQGIGLPVTRIETISQGKIDYSRVRHVDLPEADLASYRLEPGDILLSHINSVSHIGKVARFNGERPLFHGMNLMLVRLRRATLDPAYGFYVLVSAQAKTFFESRCKRAINQASLNRNDIGSLRVPVPSVPEQRKIASILTSVDDTIDKTRAVIDQLQVVKKAMMQELLTRGIPGRHARFQSTPIGEVPTAWDVKLLPHVATFQNGKVFSSRDYCERGVRLVRPGNLGADGEVVWDEKHTICLPESYEISSPGYVVGGGEILMNLTAQSLEDDFLGRVCMTPPGNHCLLNQRIARISPTDIDTRFLFWALTGPHFRRHVDRLPKGSKVQHLYNRDLETAALAVPPPEEQRAIAPLLDSILVKIKSHKAEMEQLRSVRTALMSVLLTGEVRVTPDAPAPPPPHPAQARSSISTTRARTTCSSPASSRSRAPRGTSSRTSSSS